MGGARSRRPPFCALALGRRSPIIAQLCPGFAPAPCADTRSRICYESMMRHNPNCGFDRNQTEGLSYPFSPHRHGLASRRRASLAREQPSRGSAQSCDGDPLRRIDASPARVETSEFGAGDRVCQRGAAAKRPAAGLEPVGDGALRSPPCGIGEPTGTASSAPGGAVPKAPGWSGFARFQPVAEACVAEACLAIRISTPATCDDGKRARSRRQNHLTDAEGALLEPIPPRAMLTASSR